MRILLDESLPRTLKRALPGFQIVTVPEAGWAGKKNGELLALADREFDVFLTMDKNLLYQQNRAGLRLMIVVMRARSNAIEDLLLLADELTSALGSYTAGEARVVGVWT